MDNTNKKRKYAVEEIEASRKVENIFSSLNQEDNEPNEILKAWENKIEDLLSIDYTDLSVVLEAIANVTVDELNIPVEQRAETIDFLIMYFETDPEMLESVEEIFFKNREPSEHTLN